MRVPPFVPSRIVFQRRFAAPNYTEIDPGESIHLRVPSKTALKRTMAEVLPDATVVWFNGDSLHSGRGCVLVYVPNKAPYLVPRDSYWPWYAAWKYDDVWRLVETFNIKQEDVLKLTGCISPNL